MEFQISVDDLSSLLDAHIAKWNNHEDIVIPLYAEITENGLEIRSLGPSFSDGSGGAVTSIVGKVYEEEVE